MQIGTLEGVIEIANLTPDVLSKMKEGKHSRSKHLFVILLIISSLLEFSKMVVQDWENVWSNGVDQINIEFLTSVINIMREYVPSAQKMLQQCK